MRKLVPPYRWSGFWLQASPVMFLRGGRPQIRQARALAP